MGGEIERGSREVAFFVFSVIRHCLKYFTAIFKRERESDVNVREQIEGTLSIPNCLFLLLCHIYIYIYIFFFFFFFFFLTCRHKRGRGIRTSDLRFMRHELSRLSYLLETCHIYIYIYIYIWDKFKMGISSYHSRQTSGVFCPPINECQISLEQ
jgi:hypothetical protein